MELNAVFLHQTLPTYLFPCLFSVTRSSWRRYAIYMFIFSLFYHVAYE